MPNYTYDDPNVTYDEMCFFYDGGYDLICLKDLSVTKIYGKSATGKKREKKEEIFNLFITISLEKINGKQFSDPNEDILYRFTDDADAIKAFVSDFNITLDLYNPIIDVGFINSKKSDIEINITDIDSKVEKTRITIEVPSEKEIEDGQVLATFIGAKE